MQDMSDSPISGDILYTREQCEFELQHIHLDRQKRKIIDFAIYGGKQVDDAYTL